jgi:hypothetical protein
LFRNKFTIRSTIFRISFTSYLIVVGAEQFQLSGE